MSEIGFLPNTFDAIANGDFYPLAGFLLVVCAVVTRYLLSKALPWIQTDRGGVSLVLGLGAVGGLVHALLARAQFDSSLLSTWAKVTSMAIAEYTFFKKMFFPADGKSAEMPPPGVSSVIGIAAITAGFVACGNGLISVWAAVLGAVVLVGVLTVKWSKIFGVILLLGAMQTGCAQGILGAKQSFTVAQNTSAAGLRGFDTAYENATRSVAEKYRGADVEQGRVVLSKLKEIRAAVDMTATSLDGAFTAAWVAIASVEAGANNLNLGEILSNVLRLVAEFQDSISKLKATMLSAVSSQPTASSDGGVK